MIKIQCKYSSFLGVDVIDTKHFGFLGPQVVTCVAISFLNFQNNHKWFSNQSVVISQLKDNVNISVYFIHISRLYSDWTLNDLSVKVMDSDLGNTVILLTNKHERRQMNIHNSTWGNIQTDNVQLKVSGCVINGYNRLQSALLNMKNTTMIFKYSYFYDRYLEASDGSSIISATNSVVRMENIEENHNRAHAIIHISNNSELLIANSFFQSNYIVHFGLNQSSVSLTNCFFSADIKAIFYLDTNAIFKVENSDFINSIAILLDNNNNSVILFEDTFNHTDITTAQSSHNTISVNKSTFLTGSIQIEFKSDN